MKERRNRRIAGTEVSKEDPSIGVLSPHKKGSLTTEMLISASSDWDYAPTGPFYRVGDKTRFGRRVTK